MTHGQLRDYVADLHVHTVLSPCAAVEMIPPLIVRQALARGIDLIAIADHNSGDNVGAVQRAAAGTGLTVLPGMELQTYEEVHLLCLFDTLAQLEAWQEHAHAHLPDLTNTPEFLGEQFVVDEKGTFLWREERLLLTSLTMRLETAVEQVIRLDGLAIAAHVDRPAYGLIAQLGFVPPDVPIDALEISRHLSPAAARDRIPELAGYPLIQSSDAHQLDELLATTVLTMAAPTVPEIRRALRGQQGRRCRLGVSEA